ncbi:haloacid dehalogenase type II [Falsiroseomonas bella]|uniref:Haloacid dehalogenase type II n=1 Tax=Falsiroseomonas bella TaxID=2184016 RepID=A0A317FHX2_9PROT|nr:haloacid dehalogenase type II [Falsiroseomonas bella]PWS37647.1 haloacid dehalogenase type II [Falsiroseomonas bella]
MALDQVQALLFDTFGTVVDWRNGIARDVAPFLAKHGVKADAHGFADAWRKRYRPAMKEVIDGRRPFTRLDVLHRENLEGVLRDLGADPARIPEAELDHLNRAWHRLDPWPDSIPGLTRLKKKYIIAPLSNGNIALLLNMAKRAGLPWDAILGAEVARAYKRDPKAYLNTAEILGLPPEACMLVAAHNDDLAAARKVGFATGFVLRATEHGPAQTTNLTAEEDWDVVAGNLMELADRLGCPA